MYIYVVNDIAALAQEKFIITFFPDSNIKRSCPLEQVCLNKETFRFKLKERSNVKIHLYKALKLFAYCEYVPKNEIKWHTFHLVNNKQKKNAHINIPLIKLRLKTEIKTTLFSSTDFSASHSRKTLYKSGNHSTKHSNIPSSTTIKVNQTVSNNESIRSRFREHSQQLNGMPKIIHRRNLLDARSFNNHSMEIQTLSANKDQKTITELILNRSAHHFSKSYSVNDTSHTKQRHMNKPKLNPRNNHKVISYERKCIGNTNSPAQQIKCKQKSSNFRLEKMHKQILPFHSDNKVHHVNSHSNINILNNVKEQINYDLISSYKNILEQTSTINTINNTNDKSCNIQQPNTLLHEIALSDNDNSQNHSHSLLSLSQIKSKFEETKNDYNLLYTETYFENVQNEALKLEMQLFLEKVIELQQLYHNEVSQSVGEYKQLKTTLYKYTKMYLLLKRKFNLLEEQIDLDKVTDMTKSIYKDVKWVSSIRKEMECYSFVCPSGNRKAHSLIKKELSKLFMLIVTKHKTKLNNLQRKYVEDLKNKKESIKNSSTSSSYVNLSSPISSRRSTDMFSFKTYPKTFHDSL